MFSFLFFDPCKVQNSPFSLSNSIINEKYFSSICGDNPISFAPKVTFWCYIWPKKCQTNSVFFVLWGKPDKPCTCIVLLSNGCSKYKSWQCIMFDKMFVSLKKKKMLVSCCDKWRRTYSGMLPDIWTNACNELFVHVWSCPRTWMLKCCPLYITING